MSARLSQCCGAPAIGEIVGDSGVCSDCRDHADFDPECPECGGGNMEEQRDTYAQDADGNDLTRIYLKCSDCGHIPE